MNFFYGCTLAQSFIHDKMPFAGRSNQKLQQFFFCLLIQILRMAQSITAGFKASDGFLERFFISFADAHDFANGTHLRSELVLHAFELFKCPAGEFDDNIISVRNVFVQGTVFAAGNVF